MVVGSTVPGATRGADADRTLTIGTTQEFDSINPNLAFIDSSAELTTIAYDPLVGFGPDMEHAPNGFATSWTAAGSRWTFTIRDGMAWSDGRPAGAHDVAFTYRYLLASLDPAYLGPWAPAGNDRPRPGTKRGDGIADNPLSLYGDVLRDAVGLQSVELVDERTVELTTTAPTTLLLGAAVPILPEHVWTSVTFAEAATDFQQEPPVAGTGPFQIVDWDRGRSARFVRNAFYRGLEPYVEELRFRFYADATALAEALRTGVVDYAASVAPDRFDALDAEADIAGESGLGRGYTHLAFNTYGAEIDGGGASTTAVRDPRFRDALDYAIDRDALIDDALDGHGTPGTVAMPPAFIPFHRDPTTPRSYDPPEARRRLDDAGYLDRDADGIREDADGRPIDLRLLYPTTEPKFGIAARLVADDWGRVGIGVTPEGLEADTLTERLYVPEAGGTAEYDVELWGWDGSPDPDFLLSLLTTAQIGTWSDSNYSNPVYDALFEQQRRAPTIGRRQEIVEEMLDLVYDDAPYLVLFYDDELHAHRTDRFEGWTVQPRSGGTSLFTNGVDGYLGLEPVGTTPTPGPSPAVLAPTPTAGVSPVPAPNVGPGSPTGQATPLLIGLLVLVATLDVLMVAHRWRRQGRRGRPPQP